MPAIQRNYAVRSGVQRTPILECSCGMLMSATVGMSRNTCIRCGGVEFHELARFKLIANVKDGASPTAHHELVGNVLAMQSFASLTKRPVQQSLLVFSKQ
jgi:hypothetical protein